MTAASLRPFDRPRVAGRRRLIRARDLREFRRTLAFLALSGEAFAAMRRAVLLPTQAAIALFRQTLESELTRGARAAFLLPDLLTRDTWLGRIHRSIPGAPRLLTRIEREVLMRRSAERSAARTRMTGPPFEIRPGLVSEMVGFYDELRRRQRSARRFAGALFAELGGARDIDRGSEGLIHQTCFLAFAFLAYERGVADAGGVDEHGLRQAVVDRPETFPFDHVVIGVGDHPADPRGLWPADFDLVGRMGSRIDLDLVVTDETHDAGFRQRIEQELPGIEEVRADAVWHPAPGVGEVWRPDAPVLIRPGDDPGPLCHVHHDREEELRSVARIIRQQASASGGALSEATVVVFQRPLPYLYLAKGALGDAHVPYYSLDALPLAGEPYAALVDMVVDVARTGGTRETVVSLLRSGLLRFQVDGVDVTPADASALSAILTERRASGEAVTYPDEIDAYAAGRRSRSGTNVEAARRAATAAAEAGRLLQGFRDGPSASAQVRTIRSFLVRHERLPGRAEPEGSRCLRARAAVLSLLDGLALAYVRQDDQPRHPAALSGEIRHWIERHTFAPEHRAHGVCLTDAVAARFGAFDHVHLVGLVETEWPERMRRSIFYTAGLLKSLGWPQEQDDARAQQAAFRDLARLPARTLRLHGFRLEGDAIVSLSPAVELARDLPSAVEAETLERAVFPEELLAADPPVPDGLDDGAREWLAVRVRRPPLDDPRYTGLVGSQPARAYRVSRVDRYVDCPFKFFAEDVLGLPEEREEWSGLSPLERGTLVHELFERFYREWQRAGRGTVTAEALPDALDLFARLTREALSRLPEADRALEETRLLGSIVGRGLAERVFEIEADAGGDIVDRLLEFGLEGAFAFPRLHGFDRRIVEIRGKADRVDVFAGGELRVVDYKLSRLPDRETSVQIAAYACAVQQNLEGRDGRTHPVTSAMYIAFGDERQGDGRLAAPGEPTVAAIAARASEFAGAIDRIEAGEFPPAPKRPSECQWCRYAGVCRKEYAAEPV